MISIVKKMDNKYLNWFIIQEQAVKFIQIKSTLATQPWGSRTVAPTKQHEDQVTIQGTYVGISSHRNPIYVKSHSVNVPYILLASCSVLELLCW